MDLLLRSLDVTDIDAVVQLSLLAWAPVFESFAQVLGTAIFAPVYPDWHTSQRAGVEAVCRDAEKYTGGASREGGLVRWH